MKKSKKSKTENNTNKVNKTEIFEMSKDFHYLAKFELGPNVIQDIEFECHKAENGNFTYDEVEARAYSEAEKLWPVDCFPKLELKSLQINCSETNEYCPVLSESMKKEIAELQKSKSYNRYLVLPDAKYELTPECRLWMTMREQGLIDEDYAFDFDKMHAIVEKMNERNNYDRQ